MAGQLKINPWVSIWTRPRETIRAIVDFNPAYMFPLLSFIYGFPLILQLAQNFSLGDRFPLTGILIGALIAAVFVGMLLMTISSGLLYWTGKWIGGKGNFLEIRAAISWANVPNIVNCVIWLFNIMVFKNRIFSQDFSQTPFIGHELGIIFVSSVVQVIIAVWAFIIALKALGEVQGFSAWKALLNVLIPFFMIFIGISILAWIFSMMTGGVR